MTCGRCVGGMFYRLLTIERRAKVAEPIRQAVARHLNEKVTQVIGAGEPAAIGPKVVQHAPPDRLHHVERIELDA